MTAGDPDLATTEALVPALALAGADVIELGVPFSDPMAEGPTIQRASERALQSGASLRKVLQLVARLRPQVDIPIVLMGYANNLLAMGEQRVRGGARPTSGVDGLIAVDLPPEEGEALHAALRARGVDPILLAAPTTRPERLEMLAKRTARLPLLRVAHGHDRRAARALGDARARGARGARGLRRAGLRRLRRVDARAGRARRGVRRRRRGGQRARRPDRARRARPTRRSRPPPRSSPSSSAALR